MIPFPSALEQSEMQMALSSIWTQVANFTSFDDNGHSKHAFLNSQILSIYISQLTGAVEYTNCTSPEG